MHISDHRQILWADILRWEFGFESPINDEVIHVIDSVLKIKLTASTYPILLTTTRESHLSSITTNPRVNS